MAYFSPVLTVMIGAVKKAAVAVARDFNELEHLQNAKQSDSMFARRSLEKATRTLREELSKIKSGYAVVASENEQFPESGNYFLLNAIDGYDNFAHGNAAFAVSVALVENNIITDAVIYSPISDELFFAEKGCGAFKEGFRNHERLRVAGTKNAEHCLTFCNAEPSVLHKVINSNYNVRISGSVALDLAYVAAAKADAVVAGKVNAVSLAAGMLLVKEAGGYIFAVGETDIRSEDLQKVLLCGDIVATNEALRQKIADFFA